MLPNKPFAIFFLIFQLLLTIASRIFDYNSVVKPTYISPTYEITFPQFIPQRPALTQSVLAEEPNINRVNQNPT